MSLLRLNPDSSLIDVFERVLRDGGVFELGEPLGLDEGDAMWLRVVSANIVVLKAFANTHWRRLLDGEMAPRRPLRKWLR